MKNILLFPFVVLIALCLEIHWHVKQYFVRCDELKRFLDAFERQGVSGVLVRYHSEFNAHCLDYLMTDDGLTAREILMELAGMNGSGEDENFLRLRNRTREKLDQLKAPFWITPRRQEALEIQAFFDWLHERQ